MKLTKGQETKQRITEEAKKLFYENGYNKTNLQTIAQAANAKLGTLTYHYNNKEDIVKQLYDEFISSIDKLINDFAPNAHPYTKVCFFCVVYNTVVLNDENNSRYYYEIIQHKSTYTLLNSYLREFYKNCLDSLNISFSDKDMEILLYSDAGFRREIFFHYFDKTISLSVDELIYYLTKNLSRLMGIDNYMIEENIKKAFEFTSESDLSTIKFLI